MCPVTTPVRSIVLMVRLERRWVSSHLLPTASQAISPMSYRWPMAMRLSQGIIRRALAQYQANGTLVGTFVAANSGGLSQPAQWEFARHDGNLYVASFGTDAILRYNGTTGAFIDTFVVGCGGTRFSVGNGSLVRTEICTFPATGQTEFSSSTVQGGGAYCWLLWLLPFAQMKTSPSAPMLSP